MIVFSITRQDNGAPVVFDRVALAHGGVFVRDFTEAAPDGLGGYRFTIASTSDAPAAPPAEPRELTEMSTAEVADYLAERIRDDEEERRWDAMGDDL